MLSFAPRIDRLAVRQGLLAVFLGLTLGLALGGYQTWSRLREESRGLSDAVDRLLTLASEPAAQSCFSLDFALARRVASGLMAYDYIREVEVVDELGAIFVRRSGQATPLRVSWLARVAPLPNKNLVRDLEYGEERIPVGELRVALDTNAFLRDFLASATSSFVFGVIHIGLLALVLSIVQYLYLTRPLARMAKRLRRVDPAAPGGERLEPPVMHKRDELGLLADSINVMLENVERGMRRRLAMVGEMRELKERAEEASQAKSLFIATMSHEIRTPIGNILGMTDMVLEREEELPPETLRRLGLIKDSARSLLVIVDDILDFARIESGALELCEEDFHLEETVRRTVEAFHDSARERGLALRVFMSSALPDRVRGDAGRLRQVLRNLIHNALKFTPSGSIHIHGDAMPDNAYHARFEVRDTGPGVASEQREAIFEIFTRADKSTSDGVGLGLAICKRLTELMGGRIWLESQIGAGSSFFFTVRLSPALSGPEPAATPQTTGAARPETGSLETGRQAGRTETRASQARKLLLVEDNPINQEFLKHFLSARGLQVDLATSGEQAVEFATDTPYDLILMDIQLPGIDGVEAARRIREMEQSAGRGRAPIMALTAYAMKGDRERFLNADMDDYLPKPIDLDALYATISDLLAPSMPNQQSLEKDPL